MNIVCPNSRVFLQTQRIPTKLKNFQNEVKSKNKRLLLKTSNKILATRTLIFPKKKPASKNLHRYKFTNPFWISNTALQKKNNAATTSSTFITLPYAEQSWTEHKHW